MNLEIVKELTKEFKPDIILLESGGDNLAANFSRDLADYIIYVIDVAGKILCNMRALFVCSYCLNVFPINC